MALTVGDITFSIGADTSGLDSAISKLAQFSQKVDSAAGVAARGADSQVDAYRKQEAAITSALNKVANLNAAITRGSGGSVAMLDTVTQAFTKYTNTLTKSSVSALQFQRANEQLNLTLGGVSRSLANANQAANKNAFSAMSDQFRILGAAAVLATGPLGGIATRIAAFSLIAKDSSVQTALLVGGVVLLADGLIRLSGAALNAGEQYDAFTETLTAVTGSAKLGTESFQDLQNVANTSGYQVKDLANSWITFQQATEGTSLAGQAGEKVFQDLSVIMGNLHKTPEQAASAFATLSKMLDTNSISAAQLKRQLENDLPGAYKAFQESSGLSQANFANALKKNQISPQSAIPAALTQYKSNLNIGDSVDTFTGSQNKLHNSMQDFLNDLDKASGLTSGAKSSFDTLASAISVLDGVFSTGSPALQSFITGFTVFLGTAAAITAVVTGLRAIATAIGLVDVALALNPFGLVAIAITALIAVLAGGTSAWNAYNNASNTAMNTMGDAAKQANDLAGALQGNSQIMAGNSALEKARQEATETADTLLTLQQRIKDVKTSIAEPSGFSGGKLGIATPQYTDSGKVSALAQMQTQADALQAKLNNDKDAITNLQAAMDKPATSKPAFGLNDDQINKIQATKDKLSEMNAEIDKGSAALQSGGLDAYNRLKETFSDNKEILQYAKDIQSIPDTMRDGLPTVDEFAAKLKQFRTLQDDAKLNTAAINDFENGASKAFGDISKAIGDMVTSGKLNLASLSSALQAAGADIINTAITLSVLNPLKNSIFGLSGTSGQMPTFGGTGGGSNPLGGLGFLGSLVGGGSGSSSSNPADEVAADVAAESGSSGGGFFSSIVDAASTLFANGGAFKGGVRFLANGGLLNGPTMFGTSSGVAIGGEAGTEAVMPLTRGPNGKLGVMNHGGGGVTVNIQTPNYQSFAHPQSQAQLQASLRKAVNAAQRTA